MNKMRVSVLSAKRQKEGSGGTGNVILDVASPQSSNQKDVEQTDIN